MGLVFDSDLQVVRENSKKARETNSKKTQQALDKANTNSRLIKRLEARIIALEAKQ